ncbi:hypothetical protein ACVIGA_002873 [Bradyrhizobium sp. USDA 3240]
MMTGRARSRKAPMPLGSLDYTLDQTRLAGQGAGRRTLPARLVRRDLGSIECLRPAWPRKMILDQHPLSPFTQTRRIALRERDARFETARFAQAATRPKESKS